MSIAAVIFNYRGEGPDKGRRDRITAFKPLLVGRGNGVDYALPASDSAISRKAAYLELSPEGCLLSVLPEAGEVRLNDSRVEARCVLTHGDVLQFGETIIDVSLEEVERGCLFCPKQVESPVPGSDRWEKISVYGHWVCAERDRDIHRQIGEYEVLHRLGAGGAGEVYQAYDLCDYRVWALKLRTNPLQARRFDREMYELQSLRHPNIIGFVRGSVDATGVPYYLMEYAWHGSLTEFAEELAEESRTRVLLGLLDDVLAGLAYLEENGKAHRDLKPDNILVQTLPGRGTGVCAKLSDFGLIKGGDFIDITGDAPLFCGSIPFAAPEQLDGLQGVDSRADVYAVGVSFYYLLANRLPFPYSPEDEPEQVRFAIRCARRTPLPRRPDLPEAVIRGIERACEADLKERFQTVAEFQKALRERS